MVKIWVKFVKIGHIHLNEKLQSWLKHMNLLKHSKLQIHCSEYIFLMNLNLSIHNLPETLGVIVKEMPNIFKRTSKCKTKEFSVYMFI